MLKHILKHCWWWPLEFILQPYSILERIRKNENAELISALIGSGLWGGLIGYLLWFTGYGEIYSIWIISVAGAVAGAGAIGLYLTILSFFGILLTAWLGGTITTWLLVVSISVSLFAIIYSMDLEKYSGWLVFVFVISWLVTTPLLAFSLFPLIPESDHILVSISLTIALAFGFFSGLMYVQLTEDKASSQITTNSLPSSLILLIAFPALAAWFNPWGSEQLQQLLHTVALCLLAIPILFSGVLFYPLLSIIALSQFRATRLENHDGTFAKSLPFC